MQNENEILAQLVGLEVNRTWISVGSWLWIELGELKEGGRYSSLFGEFTLEVACPWRLVVNKDDEEEILIHSESEPLIDDEIFAFLKGKKIISIELLEDEDGLFMSVLFSENHCLEIWLDKELEFTIHSRDTVALLQYTSSGRVDTKPEPRTTEVTK